MGSFNLLGAVHAGVKDSAEAQPGEATVTMVFPRDVVLTQDGTMQRFLFRQGVQEVPESMAGHPYLVAHGVRKHDKPRPQPLTLTPAILVFLQSRGYCRDGSPDEQAAAGQAKLDAMSLDDQRGFMADFTQNAGKTPDADDDDKGAADDKGKSADVMDRAAASKKKK